MSTPNRPSVATTSPRRIVAGFPLAAMDHMSRAPTQPAWPVALLEDGSWAAAPESDQAIPTTSGSNAGESGRTPSSLDGKKKKRGRPRLFSENRTEKMESTIKSVTLTSCSKRTSRIGSTRSISSLLSRRSPMGPIDESIAVGIAWPNMGEQPRALTGSQEVRHDSDPLGGGSLPEDEEGEDDGARRAIIRARNKSAATRYRAKTQAALAQMQEHERAVNTQCRALLACVTQLRDEVVELKNEVLLHANCDCPLIQGYLAEVAQRAYTNLTEPSPLEGMAGALSSMSLEGACGSSNSQPFEMPLVAFTTGEQRFFGGIPSTTGVLSTEPQWSDDLEQS